MVDELGKFYEERAHEKFPTSDNPENDAVNRRALKALELQPGQRLLDFGCSDGYFTSRLAQACPGLEAYGVDLVSHAHWRKLPSITFVAGDFPIPFPDGYFDAVFSSQVLEHLPDPALAISELSRVVKRGGRMWIATPNSYDDTWSVFHGLQHYIDKVEFHFRHFSAQELRLMFATYGCEVVNVNYDLFAGLWLYYKMVSYNPRLKKRLLKVVAPEIAAGSCRAGTSSAPNAGSSIPKTIAFAVLRALRKFDEMFSKSPLCQVIEVTVIKK